MSFQEKSLWVMAVSLAAAFSVYFALVLPSAAENVRPDQVTLFLSAVIALVAAQVAGHGVIAALGRTDTDERDRLIRLKGARNGGFALATGVFAALCVALVTPGNFAFTHLLLGFWVLAELVDIGSQLVLHRRGG
ncbi:MAG: hypothetical protein ACT4PK_02890 [Gammaproteobacteria bacterium]